MNHGIVFLLFLELDLEPEGTTTKATPPVRKNIALKLKPGGGKGRGRGRKGAKGRGRKAAAKKEEEEQVEDVENAPVEETTRIVKKETGNE